MTDNANTPVPNTNPRKRKRGFLIVPIALAAGLAGAAATHAFSGSHWGQHGGWHSFGHMGGPVQIEKRAERMIKHVAIEIDATKEQQDKLVTVAKSAIKDLLPMRGKISEARTKVRDLLTQPTIDRSAIEKLRAEQMELFDAASKRVMQAIGDAAEILTPTQRKTLNERAEQFRGFRRRWHRG